MIYVKVMDKGNNTALNVSTTPDHQLCLDNMPKQSDKNS